MEEISDDNCVRCHNTTVCLRVTNGELGLQTRSVVVGAVVAGTLQVPSVENSHANKLYTGHRIWCCLVTYW
jgi:hypothetical protein